MPRKTQFVMLPVVIVVLSLVLLLSACTGGGGGSTQSLSGRILDDVSGLLITADATVTYGGKAAVVADGEYSITGISAGTKALIVEAVGYNKKQVNVTVAAGEKKVYDVRLTKGGTEPDPALEGLSVQMVSVGRFSDIGYSMDVGHAYEIAKGQVSYGVWKQVYDWATSSARGDKKYTFANSGRAGSYGATGVDANLHPVTMVSLLDAIVWCNALTEYRNQDLVHPMGLVYYFNGVAMRNSNPTAYGDGSNIEARDANGYRVPISNEWELAARYVDGTTWNPVNHVSGDTTGPVEGVGASLVFGEYAWYKGNSGGTTHPIGTKLSNGLGLYDMSGNVDEWVFTRTGSFWIYRGGSYVNDPSRITTGYNSYTRDGISKAYDTRGFRLARND